MTTSNPESSYYLPQFHRAYLGTALWSSVDDDGNSLDNDYDVDDVSLDSHGESLGQCEAFINDNLADLQGMMADQAGHDFWLTRNGHGVGYWDRGLGDVGDRLTAACRPYGEVDVVVGDDGLLHVEG